MQLIAFDHVNIRTNNLDALVDWYTNIVGLRLGARPEFQFPGAWMYLGDQAIIHLVGTKSSLSEDGNANLEHFAIRATGMRDFRNLLESLGIAYHIKLVPGMPIAQINLKDPDGNHIHLDFDTAEYEDG